VSTFSIKNQREYPDIIYGDLVFTDKKDNNKVVRYWKSKPFELKLLQRGWMPPHPTLFMRREVYEKHGSFNINLKCAADYDYILRVFHEQSIKVIYLPEVITKMQIGGVSTTGFKSLINKKREDYWVLKSNRIPFPLWVLLLKNILKIPQLLFKRI
jgi:glycosyltransferase